MIKVSKTAVKWGRRAGITAAVILSLDLLLIVTFSLIRPTVPHIDAVIVLGAKVGTPALTARTLRGLAYYQTGKTNTLVLSGSRGPGEQVSEAEAMRQVIARRAAQTGSNTPHLVLESASTNTLQNIYNAKKLIPQAHSVVIVSDGFHLARSVMIAKRAGFQTVYWDAPAPTYYPPWDLVYYYLREAVAILVYIA